MTHNYFNYFTEIEEHFVRKRARNLLISPLDWCLIELWKENGIPLHVALRGIDRSFESTRQKRRSTPKTLFYCHPAVLEAFEEYQEAVLGESQAENSSPESGLSRESVLKFLYEIKKELGLHDGEVFARAVVWVSDLSAEISVRSELDFKEVDATLAEISSMLTEALKENLDSDTWKAIQSKCREEMKVYKKHLAPDMFEKLKRKHLERSLREHFHLPEFSLLHCE
ncbi:MAG: hypothetical protein ACWGQW_25680 [bacterium]